MVSTHHIPHNNFDETVAALQEGRVSIFPTDTVVGLGVAVCYAPHPFELARIKGRSTQQPVAWLVADASALSTYGEDVPDYAYALAKEGWPGPLTLIVRASAEVPQVWQSSEGTIGLRVPASKAAQALLEAVGCPLATSSANVTGLQPPCAVEQVDTTLLDACAVYDDGSCGSGVASAVIDCTGAQGVVLREMHTYPQRNECEETP